MRLSLLTFGFAGWGGGVDFIKFLAGAVAAVPEASEVTKQLVFPLGGPEQAQAVADFRAYFSDLEPAFEFIMSGPTYVDQLKAAFDFRADVVLPCFHAPPPAFDRAGVAWAGYLYDFQHRWLPTLFTEEERNRRDLAFHLMLHRARHVLVNARAVVSDASRFFGEFPARLHALPFSPAPQPGWLEEQRDLRSAYGLERPYFMISNQFWVHKDHPTAFRALARLAAAGGDVLLVCTGEASDHRFPDYMVRLRSLINELGVGQRVRILGRIPKLDQISLIKTSLAMVQPTRFEGGPGGGAVFDAIAVGAPVIASDIPVNREIDVGDVSFFKVGDDQALCWAMIERLQQPRQRPDHASLAAQGLERQRRCGRAMLEIARQAAGIAATT